jgi:hypothetical protein
VLISKGVIFGYMRRENYQAEGIRPNRRKVQTAILSVLAVGLLLVFPARGLGISPGACTARYAFPLNPAVLTINDSVPYAQLILYRPDNRSNGAIFHTTEAPLGA